MIHPVNVLRDGVVAEAEYENAAWRSRVFTARMCVVVESVAEDQLLVVTAWRERK